MTENPKPIILVVEPDPVQRDLIQITLQRIGCEVVTTRDPQHVAVLVAKLYPSLLLLDTFIPGSSGIEILQDLKQKKLLKNRFVVFISSYGFPEVIEQAKEAGAQEFLIKPLDFDALAIRIKSLLKI